MRMRVRLLSGALGVMVLGAVASHDAGGQTARPAIATDVDFRRAMKELSNWGRWGEQDELGAANLITPAKRKQALALALLTHGLKFAYALLIGGACSLYEWRGAPRLKEPVR